MALSPARPPLDAVRGGRHAPRDRGSGRGAVAAVVTIGLAAGVAGVTLDWRLVVPLALALPLVTWATLDAVPREDELEWTATGTTFTGVVHDVRWIAASLALTAIFAGAGLIEGTRPVGEAAAGNASIDNLLELGAVGMGTLTVVSGLRQGWSRVIPRHAWLLVAFGVLTVLSVTWSQLPLFSAARAGEFATIGGLVAYGSLRAATEDGFADRLMVHTLRYLAAVVVLLAALSVAQGGLNYERFAFRGTHANAAAALMLIVILAVALHPRRAEITRPLPWWLLPPALLPLVYATGSRAYTAAAAAALVAGATVAGLRDKRVGAFNLALGATAAGLMAGFAADWVGEYFKREQSTDTVRGLNGRLELWEWVLANPVGSELHGVGVGAVRGGLPGSWNPENAHSAWIDLLQTLGVIGVALMGAVVLAVLAIALVRRSVQATWMVVLVIISSTTSITIAQPGVVLMLLTLAAIVVAAPVDRAVRDPDGGAAVGAG